MTGTGVHGALVVLEQNSFTSDSLAGILNIPTSAPLVRKHLATELALLLSGRVEERYVWVMSVCENLCCVCDTYIQYHFFSNRNLISFVFGIM